MRDNMSTALVSAFYEVSDALYNNFKLQNPPPTTQRHLKLDKRAVGTPINGVRRHSTSSANITNGNSMNTNANANDVAKLRDRAMSESDRNQRTQTSRYKTELCRPFEENGTCKYGDKCQFAHGMHELRNLSRHPKYKSELCRTFHTVGFCPYGPRCHFIHNPEERKLGVAFAAAEHAKHSRDRTVERPKLLHFPSAPLGSSCGGDLTPPSDSPTSMTPPPSIYGDDIIPNMPLSASVLQTAVNVFNFTQRQRNQQELPNVMSPMMSPTISGVNSPFGSGPMSPFTSLQQLSAEIDQQSQPSFPPPPTSRQDSSVFFSDSNNLNDFSRNTFRPPSPPDSLSDPESSVDSMGPASPTPFPNIPSGPTIPTPNSSSSPSANSRIGRLPIFRGMSHEERF